MRSLAILITFCGACFFAGRYFRPHEALAGPVVCVEQNGDVNADGTLDISDPITLLAHQFIGDPPSLPALCSTGGDSDRIAELEALLAECEAELALCCNLEPPTKVRVISDIRCDQAAATAAIDFCGVTVSDLTDPPGITNPSECKATSVDGVCSVRVTVTAPGCNPLTFCQDVNVSPGFVYDFYVGFDLGAPVVKWKASPLGADHQPPAFFVGEFEGELDGVCAGKSVTRSAGWEANN